MPGKSSRRWLKEHFSDTYVKRAQQAGFRSRAVYKLLEIHEREHLFKSGMTVIDLGASPGGWSQLIAKLVSPKGKVVALDLLPMAPIEGVDFILGDFTDEKILATLSQHLSNQKVDWVVSDMAPNMSGNDSVDIPRAMYLAELALDFAVQVLQIKGGFLIKVFQGEGFDPFLVKLKSTFKNVSVRKPKASRGRSREIYILARNLKKQG